MAFTVLSWLVVERTDSPFIVALLGFAFFSPFLFSGILGGFLADRFERVRVLQAAQAAATAAYAILAVLLVTDLLELWHLVPVSAWIGTMWALEIPARRSLQMSLVGRDRLSSALALDFATEMGAVTVGPLLAGLLLPLLPDHFVAAGLGAASATAFVILMAARGLTNIGEAAGRPVGLRGLVEGFTMVRQNGALAATLAVVFVSGMFTWAFWPLMPVFSADILGGGPTLLGVMLSSEGVGAIASTVLIGRLRGDFRWHGRLLLIAAAATTAIGFGLALSEWRVVTVLLIVLAGVTGAVVPLMHDGLVLISTPRAARGRVLGLVVMLQGAFPVGGLMVGAIASATSPQAAVVIMSAAGVALLVLIAVASPKLRGPTQPAEE